MIKQCVVCEKKFSIKPSQVKIGEGKYCSRRCRCIKPIKKCLVCGNNFEDIKSVINKRKYCSRNCYNIGRNKKVLRQCLKCGRKFRVQRADIKRGHGKYCSINCARWKGGRNNTTEGYVLIYKPNHPNHNNGAYVLEHRFIIEQQIGRYLTQAERVHHLGEKDDNRPEKLMAFSSNSAHIRFEKNPNNVNQKEIIFDGRLLK